MKSFEEVLRSPASIDEVRFTTASADTGSLDREMITLDDSELPRRSHSPITSPG